MFNFAGLFPEDGTAINSHGVAIDNNGKVWNGPYFSRLINDGAERINGVYVYNADGTQTSFSPIIGTTSGDSLLRFGPITGVSLAADGAIYVTSHGFRMTAATDGAVVGGVWNQRRSFIHKIDAATGAGIAVIELTFMRTETSSHAPNRPAVSNEGYVAFSFLFPASPIIIVDSNDGYNIHKTITDNKTGFSRTIEISGDAKMVFNPNTEPVFAGGPPGHIQVWKADSVFDEFKIVAPLAIGTDPGALARLPGTDILFASGAGSGNAPLAGTLTMGNRYYGYSINPATYGQVVGHFDWNYASPDDPYKIPRALAFSPDGQTAIAGSFSNAPGALQRFTTSTPIVVIPDPKEDDEFTAALQVADAGTSSFTLFFGTKTSATAGFDSDLDQLAPPPPPDGAFDARIVRDGEAYFTDIQPLTESTTEWLVRFRPSMGASPITLSWDPTQLPSTGSVTMRDNIDGSFVQVDMRAQSEFVIPQAFITEVVVSHSLSQQVNLSLSSGWNLVGLPVEVTHTNYAELFAGAQAQTLFGFAQSYQQREILTPGQGYWVRYSAVADETLSGLPISKVDVDLATGWNLISGPTGTTAIADVSDPQGVILPGTLFGFAQSYQQKSELAPGRGYWIRASAAGSISIGGNQAVAREVSGAPLADLGSFDRIEIVRGGSATGEDLNHSQEEVLSRLYFGGELPEDLHELAYTMPPAAPGHSLDARFADDRWVSGSLVADVVLSGTTDVLWMRVMPAGYEGESGDGVDGAAASTTSSSKTSVYLLTAWSGEIVTDTQQIDGGALMQLSAGTDRVTVERLDGSELSPEGTG
jgi:hypothetical protein